VAGVSPAGAGETVIRNGQPIGGFRGSRQSMWVGRIHVPAGRRQLVVSTSGGYGDCDLYLRHERSNQGQWDFRSKSNDTDEQIAVTRPAEGWWQVGLLASGNYTGVTLVARFDEPHSRDICNCGCKGDKHEHERRARRPDPRRHLGGLDEFEPNSKRELALQIFAGRSQLHTINPDGDEDWIMFAPRQTGRYVLELTNVTLDLKGELWVQSGRNKEKRVEKFKVDRGRNGAIHLDVAPGIGYFKVRIEADDNDDTGSYRLSVSQPRTDSRSRPHLNVRRPDVFESDNKRESAVGIRNNSTQLHTIYPRDDEDWLMFAPPHRGEYLLRISGATVELDGEVWIRRRGEKERKIGNFKVSRSGKTIPLSAKDGIQYFKIRLEADDNDDTADYRVEVVGRSIRTSPSVIRPSLRTPPIYSRDSRRDGSYSAGIIPRILGSVLGR